MLRYAVVVDCREISKMFAIAVIDIEVGSVCEVDVDGYPSKKKKRRS